ncbi:hypothetical protein HGM15179_005282 [Zosterops borbonicus]|uniref:Uncharacterized protein n=1 Tax=Zosterops borbonicus TaxID=364589 RepID=A0A8K1LPR3_9PASS|nr:hypothetical protein HGM15179_005282 [Zosterops borbonicus]
MACASVLEQELSFVPDSPDRKEASPPFLIALVLASGTSVLEPAGIVPWWAQRKLLAASHRGCPLAPHYQNLAMQTQYNCLVPSDGQCLFDGLVKTKVTSREQNSNSLYPLDIEDHSLPVIVKKERRKF